MTMLGGFCSAAPTAAAQTKVKTNAERNRRDMGRSPCEPILLSVAGAAPDSPRAQIPVKKNPAASSRSRARVAGKNGRLLVWVFDPRVAECNQTLGKTLFNEMKFRQRQTTLLKL